MTRLGAALVLFAGLCILPPGAAGGPPDAPTLQKRARTLFDAGDYAGAIELWEQARGLLPDPQYTLNIAVSWHKLGRLVDAWETYQDYLAVADDGERTGKVAEFLRQIEEALAATHVPVTIRVEPARGFISLVREGRTRKRSGELQTWLLPGRHTVSATAEGFRDAVVELRVLPGGPHVESIRLSDAGDPPPVDVPAPPPPLRPSSRPSWLPWTLLGAGVGVAAGGLGLNLGGVDLARRTNRHPDAPAYEADWRRAEDLTRAGYALYAIGGAAVVSGAVLALVDATSRDERPTETTAWRLRPSPSGFLLELGF